MKGKKAFTLVELLVVIGVICILAAVMVPILTGVLNKTNEQADEVSAGLYTSVMQQLEVLEYNPHFLSQSRDITAFQC